MKLRSKELWVVGFFLSKFGEKLEGKETQPPIELNTMFWGDVYRKFYHSLGDGKAIRTFERGLKNCRDTYDGHTATSGRIGWRDLNGKPVKLASTAKSVFNKYNIQSREEIWEEIQGLALGETNPSVVII